MMVAWIGSWATAWTTPFWEAHIEIQAFLSITVLPAGALLPISAPSTGSASPLPPVLSQQFKSAGVHWHRYPTETAARQLGVHSSPRPGLRLTDAALVAPRQTHMWPKRFLCSLSKNLTKCATSQIKMVPLRVIWLILASFNRYR